MNEKAARRLLSCHLAEPFADPPPQVEKALKALSASPELEADYARQVELDRKAVAALGAVAVPDAALEGFSSKLGEAASRLNGIGNPAMAAVGIGFALMVAVLVWNFLGRPAAFPPDAVEVSEAALKFDGTGFEEAGIPAGELGDWFMLRGFEGFFVPKGLGHLQAGSASVSKIGNQPVAVVDAGDGSARFVVFKAAALGVVVPPGEWRSGDVGGGKAGALRVEDGMCFLVLVKGSAADASDYARRMAP